MTEKIQKAIDKIDQEAEKMGSATVRLLCSHIIDHNLVNDENADKVLAEGKSLKGCWDYITSNARKQAATAQPCQTTPCTNGQLAITALLPKRPRRRSSTCWICCEVSVWERN